MVAWHLGKAFLRIFMRDRQSMFMGMIFPMVFLVVLGNVRDGPPTSIDIGVVNAAQTPLATMFVETLDANSMFEVELGDESPLREKLLDGQVSLVVLIPEGFDEAATTTDLRVLVDAAQVRLLALIQPALEDALLDVERAVRGTPSLFSITLEDIKSRSQRYVDFLLPGMLAFTLMQISIAGSGFNLVEYRRKGILRQLFVTPIRPRQFIAALCGARMIWALMQLTALLAMAVFFLDVEIVGHLLELYVVIVLGAVIFLCFGFCVGSIARTQQAVGAVGNLVIFPQLFLSGVFFPIEAMPDVVQPVARLLPLSYVVDGLRAIATDGLGLLDVLPSLAGIIVWGAIAFVAATRLFVWKEVVR